MTRSFLLCAGVIAHSENQGSISDSRSSCEVIGIEGDGRWPLDRALGVEVTTLEKQLPAEGQSSKAALGGPGETAATCSTRGVVASDKRRHRKFLNSTDRC